MLLVHFSFGDILNHLSRDALRFLNPFPTAITTAPVSVIQGTGSQILWLRSQKDLLDFWVKACPNGPLQKDWSVQLLRLEQTIFAGYCKDEQSVECPSVEI